MKRGRIRRVKDGAWPGIQRGFLLEEPPLFASFVPMPLWKEITDHVAATLEEIGQRYLEGPVRSGFLAGYPVRSDSVCDYLFDLGLLVRLGRTTVGGERVEERVRRWLPCIRGAETETFYSYRLAETLLAYGPFKDNPLLAGLSEEQLENLAAAVDSTHIAGQWGKPLGGRPNNYWGVLARCEEARRRLGLLEDEALLGKAVARMEALLFENPEGFFDDSEKNLGCYDSYSADVLLFLEPLWDRFAKENLRHTLARHVDLFESIAMENGASVVWGRSTGALSLMLNMEMLAVSLREQLASDPARGWALIRHSFENWKRDWMENALITAHRHRSPYAYRGPHRVLQMTLDCLGKLAQVASILRDVEEPEESVPARRLFPEQDAYHRFAANGAGVWMLRNHRVAFQLAVVNRGDANADYLPAPRAPGLFDHPVDVAMPTFQPRILEDGEEWNFVGLPEAVQKEDASLRLIYSVLRQKRKGGETRSGRREVVYTVKDDALFVEETLELPSVPEALSVLVPESGHPLSLRYEEGPPHRWTSTCVKGMKPARSFWGELSRFHELHLQPAKYVHFRYSVRPKLRVLAIPGDHDYVRALYDHLPAEAADQIEVDLVPQQMPLRPGLAREWGRRYDVLHIGWPEHLFGGDKNDQYKADYHSFLDELSRQPLRIVWTMHNRLPHHGETEWVETLYRRWARLAHAVAHHSECGKERCLRELPYRKEAVHRIIYHPHYGEAISDMAPRAELERELGLPPAPVRIGMIGRPQKEKQVERILAAFARAENPQLQLLVTAVRPDTPLPADERIHAFPYTRYYKREEIATYTGACDLLISCPSGDRYLTSGIVADAVAHGLGLIINDFPFLSEIMGAAALPFDGSEDDLCRLFEELTPQHVAATAKASRKLQRTYHPAASAKALWELFRTV